MSWLVISFEYKAVVALVIRRNTASSNYILEIILAGVLLGFLVRRNDFKPKLWRDSMHRWEGFMWHSDMKIARLEWDESRLWSNIWHELLRIALVIGSLISLHTSNCSVFWNSEKTRWVRSYLTTFVLILQMEWLNAAHLECRGKKSQLEWSDTPCESNGELSHSSRDFPSRFELSSLTLLHS